MKICIGTAQFGLDYGINNLNGKPDESNVYRILDYAHLKGIRHLDTADAYGDSLDILGRYFRQSATNYVIHNKFGVDGTPLKQMVIKALNKLNRSKIETYYFHTYSDYSNYPTYHQQISELKEEGLINSIGVSIYENEEFEAACNEEIIDVIQLPYNLLDNYHQRGSLMEYAKSLGKKLHIRSIFLQGLFFLGRENLPSKLSHLVPYLAQIKDISRDAGVSVNQLAMGYAMQTPGIDKVILGVDSLDQLEINLRLSEIILPRSVIDRVGEIHVNEAELLYPKNW